MKYDKRAKVINFIALIIAIVGLTIAFLAMSRTYIIQSVKKKSSVNWNIYFENVVLKSKSDNAVVSSDPTPTFGNTSTTIENIDITLKEPGDYVTYTADITNKGNIDAEISSIIEPNLTERQRKLLDFKVHYTDKQIKGTRLLEPGDIFYLNETKNITITFKYKDITDENLLSDVPEKINVSYSIVYVQPNSKK